MDGEALEDAAAVSEDGELRYEPDGQRLPRNEAFTVLVLEVSAD